MPFYISALALYIILIWCFRHIGEEMQILDFITRGRRDDSIVNHFLIHQHMSINDFDPAVRGCRSEIPQPIGQE